MALSSLRFEVRITAHARTFLLAGVLILLSTLNFFPRDPARQSPADNYTARYGACTEKNWGWPFKAYCRYGGGGYIDPGEWLAWDVAPVYSRWQPMALGADLAVVMIAVSLVLWAWRYTTLDPAQCGPLSVVAA